jgi:hypothetical protein
MLKLYAKDKTDKISKSESWKFNTGNRKNGNPRKKGMKIIQCEKVKIMASKCEWFPFKVSKSKKHQECKDLQGNSVLMTNL